MNIPRLTNKELDSIYAIKFTEDPALTAKQNETLQTETAKKIMAILIFNTDLEYPPEVLKNIQETAERINAEELQVKLIDNNNPENNSETIIK